MEFASDDTLIKSMDGWEFDATNMWNPDGSI